MERSKQSKISFRYFLISILVVVMCLFVIGKVIEIIFIEGEGWNKKSEAAIMKNVKIPAHRGNILSADDEIVASTIKEYKLFFDFRDIKDNGKYVRVPHPDTLNKYIDDFCLAISKKLGDKSASEYKKKLLKGYKNKSGRVNLSPKVVSYLDLLEIKKFPLVNKGGGATGFFVESQEKREMPFGKVASRTIGRLKNGKAEYGIELAYDSILRGKDGKADFRIIRKQLVEIRGTEIPKVDGCDIRTTIDLRIQYLAEEALLRKLKEVDADNGSVIVMEVETGAVKAIANYSRIKEGKFGESRNFAISGLYQPGSTFKTVAITAALDDGVTTPAEIFDTEDGTYTHRHPNGRNSKQIRDWNAHRGGFGPISVTRIMEESSNIGTAKVVLKGYENNPQKFLDKLDQMGINEKVDLKLIGQAYPQIPKLSSKLWSYTTLPWMSFGYNIQVPPIYSLMFYNAIANGGKMISPIFVTDILKEGKVIEHIDSKVVREQICKPKTITQVREILTSVVQNGTAQNLKSPNVSIAGKTGTVIIYSGEFGYDPNARTHRVSFCGYFPDDEKPKYSCIVVVTRPRGVYPSAGPIAGGVLKEIAENMYALGYLNEAPQLQAGDETKRGPKISKGIDSITETLCDSLNIKYIAEEHAEEITADTCDVESNDIITLPSVIGMGIRDAIYTLEDLGVKVTAQGRGYVKQQIPSPGTPYNKGDEVIIILEN